MKPVKKILLTSLIALGAFGLGLSLGRKPEVQIKVEEKTVFKERIETKDEIIQQNDQTTIIEKRADGTTVTTIRDQGSRSMVGRRWNEVNAFSDRKFSKTVSSTSRFSLGVSAHSAFADLLAPEPYYEIEFGRRVIGNAWITGSFDVQKKSAGVGVRMEF